MTTTKIQWTDSTWNPVTGCTKISEGCRNCYAEIMTRRLKAMGQEKYKEGFDKVVCHYEANKEPFRWKKGRKIFVCSMSDLFHEDVPYEFINKVFNVIRFNPQHTFQILTKRSSRLFFDVPDVFYPDNLWLGVTVENQEQANERIPLLLRTTAKVKFVSIEPMLGPIDLTKIPHFKDHLDNQYYRDVLNQKSISGDDITNYPGQLDWVICGGESGHKARPMHPDWVRSIRDQCMSANVPFFFKQWGGWAPDGNDEVMTKPMAKRNKDWLDGQRHHEFPEINL